MLIQCTSCKATARLSDDKEGAKVRCPSCSHVYVARPAGSRGSTRAKSDNTQLMIFGGVGLVGVIILVIAMSGGDAVPVTKGENLPDLIEEYVEVDVTGWDSPLVQVARKLHKSAFQKDRARILQNLAIDRVYIHRNSTSERQLTPGDWKILSKDDQILFEEDLITALFESSRDNLVASWKPFDGSVVTEEDDIATVRIVLEPRDASLGVQARNIEWRFISVNGKWKAWSWERWISPSEKRGQLITRTSSTKKVTLDDGSQVLEAEPGPLDWMPGTTSEERTLITGLIATMCASDTRGAALYSARQDLVAICKPAVPALLTKFYELDLEGFDSYENQVGGMQVHQVLTQLTGYVTTFKAHEALGGTDQRRSSGVKQWFSWYHRRFKRFECTTAAEPEEEELLFEPKTEQERRDLERARREAGNQ